MLDTDELKVSLANYVYIGFGHIGYVYVFKKELLMARLLVLACWNAVELETPLANCV